MSENMRLESKFNPLPNYKTYKKLEYLHNKWVRFKKSRYLSRDTWENRGHEFLTVLQREKMIDDIFKIITNE